MRVIVGWRGPEKPAASTNTLSRFETEVLTRQVSLEGLARLNAHWVQQGMASTTHRRIILNMDSSESPMHGEQDRAAYNGHFQSVCYHPTTRKWWGHPLFLFNQFGDC